MILSRVHTTSLNASGTLATIQTRSDQWLHLSYEDTTGWTELINGTITERCQMADQLTRAPPPASTTGICRATGTATIWAWTTRSPATRALAATAWWPSISPVARP